MSTRSFQALKRAEARARMADLRRARKSRRAALAFEHRHALVSGATGQITNLAQVMRAMGRWSKQS